MKKFVYIYIIVGIALFGALAFWYLKFDQIQVATVPTYTKDDFLQDEGIEPQDDTNTEQEKPEEDVIEQKSGTTTLSDLVSATTTTSSTEPEVDPATTTKQETAPKPPASNIPDAMKLSVPFTSQAPEKNWDEPWQNACEEAALLMVDAFHQNELAIDIESVKADIIAMVEWQEDKKWFTSIPAVKVQTLAEEFYDLTLKIEEYPTEKSIKNHIAAGRPVLALVDGKALENPYFTNGGPDYHALVIIGYTKDSYITNDPGTAHGKDYVYKKSVLLDAIHDWNGGKVASGTPRILY